MSAAIRKLTDLLPKNGFVRSVTVLAGGTAMSQIILVVASPLMTRIYTPAEFGLLAVYTSILSVILVISSLRYELAIPLPTDDRSAANIVAVALSLVGLCSFVVALGVFFLGSQITYWAGVKEIHQFLWLLPLSVLTAGSYQTLTYWASRRRQFKQVAFTKTMQGIAQAAIQVGGGLLHFGPVSLIGGYILGQFVGVGSLIRQSALKKEDISGSSMRRVVKLYQDFPLYTSWASLLNVIGTQIPAIMMFNFFGSDTAGLFSLVMRVLGLPTALIGQAVAQVFYPVVSAAREDGEKSRMLILQVGMTLFSLSCVVFSLIMLHGPTLFGLAFGNKWTSAGAFAQYLAPWFLFSFVSTPLSTFVLVKGKQRQAFMVTFYETSLRVGAMLIGRHYGSANMSVVVYGLAGALISVLYLGWVMRLSGIRFTAVVKNLSTLVGGGAALIAVLWTLTLYLPSYWSLACSAVSLGALGVRLLITTRRRLQVADT